MANPKYSEFFPDVVTEPHCVMVEFHNQGIMDYIKSIPEDCIYEEAGENYGRETIPHITVLYGIAPSDEEKAKHILSKIPGKIIATLGKISKFESPSRPFDVLKIEVTSPQLVKIHDALKRACKNNEEWPVYSPHVTLAYVKKGTCDECIGDARFSGTKLAFDRFAYNNGVSRERSPIPMAENWVGNTGGGYGGAAGGYVAPSNWAGTPSGPQTSGRLSSYPDTSKHTYMQGNTIIATSLWDTITKDDLKDPRFTPTEIFAGLRYEMKRMEYPDKVKARIKVLHNLEKDPNYYGDLGMYFNSDKV